MCGVSVSHHWPRQEQHTASYDAYANIIAKEYREYLATYFHIWTKSRLNCHAQFYWKSTENTYPQEK